MKQILDHNPATGETVYLEFNGDTMRMTHTQDVTPVIERAKAWANKTSKTDFGIKNDWWHYARVPNIVIMEMKQKHGVDFYDPNDKPKVFKLLNDEYSYCKTTHKNHSIKHA